MGQELLFFGELGNVALTGHLVPVDAGCKARLTRKTNLVWASTEVRRVNSVGNDKVNFKVSIKLSSIPIRLNGKVRPPMYLSLSIPPTTMDLVSNSLITLRDADEDAD